jgi:hypothetical protein
MASLKQELNKQNKGSKLSTEKPKTNIKDDWSLESALESISDENKDNLEELEIREVLAKVPSVEQGATRTGSSLNVSKTKEFNTDNNMVDIASESSRLIESNNRFDPTLNIRSPQFLSAVVAHHIIKLQTSLRNQGYKSGATSESRIMDQYLRKVFNLSRDDSQSDSTYRRANEYFSNPNNKSRVLVSLTPEEQKELRQKRAAKKLLEQEEMFKKKYGIK